MKGSRTATSSGVDHARTAGSSVFWNFFHPALLPTFAATFPGLVLQQMRLRPDFHGRGAALGGCSGGFSCASVVGIVTGGLSPSALIVGLRPTATSARGTTTSVGKAPLRTVLYQDAEVSRHLYGDVTQSGQEAESIDTHNLKSVREDLVAITLPSKRRDVGQQLRRALITPGQ